MGLAIFFDALPTGRTGTTRIPRINDVDSDTAQSRLVRDKLLQLPERPTVEGCPLLPSSPDPRPDMRQIFQRYLSLRAFGKHHQLFGDLVIDHGGKAPFFPAQLFELALRGFRAFGLKFGSQTAATVADTQHGLAAVDVPVAIGGDVLHTKINAQRAVNVQRRGFFHVADRTETM